MMSLRRGNCFSSSRNVIEIMIEELLVSMGIYGLMRLVRLTLLLSTCSDTAGVSFLLYYKLDRHSLVD